MHRLFVAIRPPRPIIDQLLGQMGGISGARWQTEDQLHLTLRFIGEVGPHHADDIHAALCSVRHPRFDVELNGLGSFERRGRIEVVWAGVSPHEPLKSLHRKVDQAIVRAGLEPERRAYAPHITLARLKPGSGPVRAFLEQPSGRSVPFAVDAFCLYESGLTPEGAVYTIIERYPLG
jgi:2'-5' RNA ligase